MAYDPKKHHRHSIRLRNYDYASAGAYYVTICSFRRECLLGDVVDGNMVLNSYGHLAAAVWLWLEDRYPYVRLDAWVLMPNHMHGVLVILADAEQDGRRGGSRTAPTHQRKSLGRLVGAFKTVSTKHINILRDTPGMPVWQRNYHERVIRNGAELQRIRAYIGMNPARWPEDDNHPSKVDG